MGATLTLRLTNQKTTMKYDNDDVNNMLTDAIEAKDLDRVRDAFKMGADPNGGVVKLSGWRRYYSNFYLMLKVFPEALPVFLENGLDLNEETFCANALMDAIDAENTEAIRKLFEAGAKDECFLDEDDPEGSLCSSIFYAVTRRKELSLHALLEMGCSSGDGESVISEAMTEPNERMVRDLVDHGCVLDPDREDLFVLGYLDEGDNFAARVHDCISIAKKTRKKPWALFDKFQTYDNLVKAIKHHMRITLLTLLDDGASIRTGWGDPLLSCAVEYNNVFAIKELIERGADINERDFSGKPPIFRLKHKCSLDTVKILVGLGADINAKDDFGISLLASLDLDIQRAEKNSLPEEDIERMKIIRQYLVDNGAVYVNECEDALFEGFEQE